MELPRAEQELFDTNHRAILDAAGNELILQKNGVKVTMHALTHPPRIAVMYGRQTKPDWTLRREENGVELKWHADNEVEKDRNLVAQYVGWIGDYVTQAQA